MLTRRHFIRTAALVSGGFWVRLGLTAAEAEDGHRWFMPDESAPHRRTWMAFGASRKIWGKRLLPEVRRNIATIARTITEHEPVSMLVTERDRDLAGELVGPKVELVTCPLDDVWIRDTGPVFVINAQGDKAAIDFNFNGWGGKQAHARDAKVARFVAQRAGAEVIPTKLVLEGGGIEVDGQGTAVIAESCVLNANRNPGLTKAACETQLEALLGVEKVIWLPGIKGEDITDGHTDFYARFARPGVVLAGYEPDPAFADHAVTKKNLEVLRAATDARGRRLDVMVLQAPQTIRETFETNGFAAGYAGFYVCNGAVIAQEFGDAEADGAAKQVLQAAFPDRKVVQLNVDGLAAGGGSIHCITQQEPMA